LKKIFYRNLYEIFKPLCDSLLDHLSRAELTCNTTVRIQVRF
jgi:hypothetical protein